MAKRTIKTWMLSSITHTELCAEITFRPCTFGVFEEPTLTIQIDSDEAETQPFNFKEEYEVIIRKVGKPAKEQQIGSVLIDGFDPPK